jgi:hypothetical protein
MKCVLLLVIMFCGTFVFSQNVLFDPVSSRIFNPEKYSDVSGSAFLSDKWQTGDVTTSKGVYKNLELKLDAYSNTLFFKRNDQPYEFQDPVRDFTLTGKGTDSMFYKKGFSANGLKPDQFVQVLAQGKTSLYRSDQKSLSEINQINKGLIKTFTTSVRYFISQNDRLQLVKLNKKEMQTVLKDQQVPLEEFTTKNKLSYNREADVVKMVRYLNTL